MSDQEKLRVSILLNSIEYWEKLADGAEEFAAYEREIGIDQSPPGQSVGDRKAATYRRAAEALRIQMNTGIPVCTCCHKPFSHPGDGRR